MIPRSSSVAALLSIALSVTAAGGRAGAQSLPPEPAAPTTEPAAQAASTAATTQPEATGVDPAEIRAAYDRAFAALVSRDWATAVALFDDVAARSVEAERRGAARELARYARQAPAAELTVAHREMEAEDRTSGRAAFVVSTTIASFYAGIVLDDLLAITGDKASIAVVTASTATGLVASLLGSRALRLSEGTAAAYSNGLMLGLANGLLLAPPLGVEPDADCGDVGCPDGDVNQAYLGVGLAAMIAGGAAGTYLGERFNPTAPQARLVSMLAFNGLATAGAVQFMLTDDDSGVDSDDVLLVLGAGLDVGLAVGFAIAPRIDWSGARMTYVSLGQSVGTLGGFATAAILLDDESERTFAGVMLAGAWAGFAGAAYLTRDMKPHRRFARPATGPAVTVAPMATDDGGRGVSVAGSF